jgi:predicted lipid-binding transport protein (Tim44 family)
MHGGGLDLSFGTLVTLLVVGLIVWYLYRRFAGGGGLGAGTGTFGGASYPPAAGSAAPAAVAAPPTGTTLAAVGAAAIAAAYRADHLGATHPGTSANSERPGVPLAVESIRAADPAFEIETFLQRAEMTLFLVKRGIQRNEAAAIRPYVDDAVFAIVTRNLGQMAAQHVHTLLESLNVRAVHLVDAANEAAGQRLVVHFDLVYRAKTIDETNRVVADEGRDGRHGERWTFVRSASARTPGSGGVIAARCPACGAELRLSLDGNCTHCRASVTNGSVDWVVADVQAAAFVGFGADPLLGLAAPTPAAGVASLRAADAAFDLQAFAARVQTAFLALQQAWCAQNLEAGRAFLSPGCYFAWRAQLEIMMAEGRRNIMEHVRVLGIEPTRVIHGRVFDDLTVRIRAEAADYELDANGHLVFGGRSVEPFVEEWTFQRSVGVASSAKAGTLENTCPNCGAPLVLTQIGECRYCRAAVTSGRFDWVVSRIEQEGEFDDPRTAVDAGEDVAGSVANFVGGAIIGSVLSSLLSNREDLH